MSDTPGNSIRIADLAHPVLTPAQRAALDATREMQVDLGRDSILAEASARTGLDDFGSPDFLQRLDLLCDEWGSDPGLTNIARIGLRSTLVMHASSRLLIQQRLSQHPEILDEEIRAPIIVVGMPRSGTTHLLNLMAADQRLRALPLWEAYEPVPRPGEPASHDRNDPRWQRCQARWEAMQQLTPLVAAMHPMDPDHIHEELELMGPDFASYNYEWLSHSPRWRDHYLSHDQTPHYAYMKNVLRLLQWQDRQRLGPAAATRRWVLKCPQHLEQLPVLTRVFPDATIAVTHRDPVAVIQSALMPLAYGQRINRKQVMVDELLAYWVERIEHLLRACVRDRPGLDPARSIDVPFHTFMADDLAMVERIFERAGLDVTDASRARLREHLAANPRGKHGRIIYKLREDFGADPAALRERFRFYFEAFPVQAEVD